MIDLSKFKIKHENKINWSVLIKVINSSKRWDLE